MNWIVLFLSLLTQTLVLCVEERCTKSSVTSFKFEPSLDGVKARYTAEYCIQQDAIFEVWKLYIYHIRNVNESHCLNSEIKNQKIHYLNSIPLNKTLQCPNARCFSIPIDMVVTGCYYISNDVQVRNRNLLVDTFKKPSRRNNSRKYIRNDISSYDYFLNTKTTITCNGNGKHVSLNWQFGHIPFSEFNLKISCKNSCSDSFQGVEDAEPNCTSSRALGPTAVTCDSLLLPPGCYDFWLRPIANWTTSPIFGHIAEFETDCCNLEREAGEAGGAGEGEAPAWRFWAWRAAAGAGALAAGALAGAALWRRRQDVRRWNKRLLLDWRNRIAKERVAAETETEAGAGAAGGGEVVLLYARSRAAARSVAALSAALAGGGVRAVDVHSADTLAAAAAAGAPRAWLAALLGRGARVLVLRTPALAPRERTARQRPTYSDELLRFALATLAETPPLADQYRRYFIAELEGVPCGERGWGGGLGALRVYALPGAAAALLRDLDAGGADEAVLARLRAELAAFAAAARPDPACCADELVYLDR